MSRSSGMARSKRFHNRTFLDAPRPVPRSCATSVTCEDREVPVPDAGDIELPVEGSRRAFGAMDSAQQ